MDALNDRLFGLVYEELVKQLSETDLGGLEANVDLYPWDNPNKTVEPPSGYLPRQQQLVSVLIRTGAPANVSISQVYDSFVALPDSDGADFVVVEGRHPEDRLEVSLRDIRPMVSHVLELKIGAWVEGEIRRLVHEVVGASTLELQRRGYLD
jgi:hypothetical protein